MCKLPDCSEMWCDSPKDAAGGQIVLCAQAAEEDNLELLLQDYRDLEAIMDAPRLPQGRHAIVQAARATKDAVPKAKAKGKGKTKAMVVKPKVKRAAWRTKVEKNTNDVYSGAYRAAHKRACKEGVSEPEGRQRAKAAGRAAVQVHFG